MTPARLEIVEYSLPLRRPLRGPFGVATRRDGFIVVVHADDGAWGCGEAAPAWWVGAESVEAARAALEAAARAADGGSEPDPHALAGSSTAAALALETALLDLRARRAGVSFAQRLAGELEGAGGTAAAVSTCTRAALPGAIDVNALLTADEPYELEAEAAHAVEAGYTTLKLKVGGHADLGAAGGEAADDRDVERVRAARRGAAARARLRLDANRAWSFERARAVLDRLAADDVEYVEEPLASADPAQLAALAAATGCRLAADESVQDAADLARLIEHRSVAAVVLKPARIGGYVRIAGLIARARDAGLAVTLTDSIETRVGRAAVAHAAAAICGDGSTIGLGGAAMLGADIGGAAVDAARSVAVDGPGLGLALAAVRGRAR